MISFFVPAIPKGQARARHAVIHGHARTYKASSQKLDEQTLAALMMPFKPPNPLVGPLSVSIRAFMPIPKSKPKKWQIKALEHTTFPTGRPDLDNVAKGVLDVLVSMRFIEDDRQICELYVSKDYGTTPGYRIAIQGISEGLTYEELEEM